DSLLERRKLKQPLDYPSAGSVFKRPEGNFAGTLIQECGLKGKTIGGAQVSEKHAGFIINIGNATTKDITDLIDFVQATVQKEKNVLLEKELRVIE
ncbi:MAG: UDP-N-acetylenolpyruvoylglucosamine reductase, partial [Oscillospiraceae bacterium]